jgi:hypothetical protein
MRVKKSFAATACRLKKNTLHQKLSEKAESSQTSPFSDNFCDTIDIQ